MKPNFFTSLINLVSIDFRFKIIRVFTIGLIVITLLGGVGALVYKYSGWFNRTESDTYLTQQQDEAKDWLKKAKQADSTEEKLKAYQNAASGLNSTYNHDELVPLIEKLRSETPKEDSQYPFVLKALVDAYFASGNIEATVNTQKELLDLYDSDVYPSMPYRKEDALTKLTYYQNQQKTAPDLSIPDPNKAYGR